MRISISGRYELKEGRRARWRSFFILLLAACVVMIAAAGVTVQTPAVTTAEQDRIELYPYAGPSYLLQSPPPDVHPAVFMVPQEFRWGSTRNVAQMNYHAWGIQILTYYPSFSSPAAPQNKDFGLDCIGYCNGRILIYISYNPQMLRAGIANTADATVHGELENKNFITGLHLSNVTYKDLSPRGPFDGGFEHIAMVRGAQPPKIGLDDQVLWRKAESGHYDLVAKCAPDAPNPLCHLIFSSSCNPAISVQVSVGMRDIDRAADIKDKTDAFLLPMIKSCNS
ncbi:MAG TPA: hypothetical protein VJQ06_01680 [Rhizomicrobium sp.]|nr:hypothetical protein [Rhizomicrobium sp.]